MNKNTKGVRSNHTRQLEARPAEGESWRKWLEHWETWNAIVAEVKPPQCGLFGCDEKVKVGGKWKCTACGKITETRV